MPKSCLKTYTFISTSFPVSLSSLFFFIPFFLVNLYKVLFPYNKLDL